MEPGHTGNGVPDAAGKRRDMPARYFPIIGFNRASGRCRPLLSFFPFAGRSGVFDVLNHSADKVNEVHKNVHSMAKRQGAAVMSLPYVLPLVLPIVIPVLAVVYFLKKPLLRREAGKLSQRWRLETDVNTTVQFASEDIKKQWNFCKKMMCSI